MVNRLEVLSCLTSSSRVPRARWFQEVSAVECTVLDRQLVCSVRFIISVRSIPVLATPYMHLPLWLELYLSSGLGSPHDKVKRSVSKERYFDSSKRRPQAYCATEVAHQQKWRNLTNSLKASTSVLTLRRKMNQT